MGWLHIGNQFYAVRGSSFDTFLNFMAKKWNLGRTSELQALIDHFDEFRNARHVCRAETVAIGHHRH